MSDSILEQYKLYVEMADRISERRMNANRFYMALLSGLLIMISFVVNKDNINALAEQQFVIYLATGILGALVCIVWFINIRSYRQLNTAKFQVIHEIEETLSYAPYKTEWEILGKGSSARSYLQLTRIEAYVPLILILPYLTLIIYAIKKIF